MIPEMAMLAVLILLLAAERLHAQRVRRVAPLAFGPVRKPASWARTTPLLRVVGAATLTWGLTTLLLMSPKVHKSGTIPEGEYRDLLLLLDVSPSMRLQDAGVDGKQSRRQRAAAILHSFFERVPMELYRTTVVAVYNGAKPVVVRTTDPEVVRNILEDLPMEYGFKAGPTDLFSGLEEGAKIARPWRPKATTMVIVSDGDTIPATGMRKLPDSIAHVVVVGVGDPHTGKFIDGHLSRQDTSALRQLAARLNGVYHNGNDKHLSTELVQQATLVGGRSAVERLTRREYALLAIGFGATLLALLPLLLHYAGTRWRPGVPLPDGAKYARRRPELSSTRS